MSKPVLATFDVESTGVSVEEDRIVTAVVGLMQSDGEWFSKRDFLINPGIEIPQGAIDVHGITNEIAATGSEPSEALSEIAGALLEWDIPVVIYNATFDTSMLDRELRRYDLPTIEWPKVIDPLVLDKEFDSYRRGSRKLVDTAAHYGITVDQSQAHDASYDCWLAGNIALKMRHKLHQIAPDGKIWPWLMDYQRHAKAGQSASLQEYFRKKDPEAIVDGSWPMKPFVVA